MRGENVTRGAAAAGVVQAPILTWIYPQTEVFSIERVKAVIEGVRSVNKFANQSNNFCTDMQEIQKVKEAIKIHNEF